MIPLDKIVLDKMEFYGFHGVEAREGQLGQKFVVSLEVYCDLKKAGRSDKLTDTLDYVSLYQAIRKLVEEGRFALLEALAREVACACFLFPQVLGVRVKIEKPQVSLPGSFVGIGVEIERWRVHRPGAGAVEHG
ncbi:MAG: dihydroneopterin aldolase [Clostridia bacterium]|nr:MAG: dihydroneopterin aldolase [Clostridia bacterium]